MPEDTLRAEVAARNALRRDAKLPLLDENVEVGRGLARERQQSYDSLLARHSALLQEFKHQALAEYEHRNGQRPNSVFAWWGVHLQAQERFESEIERRFGVSRQRL